LITKSNNEIISFLAVPVYVPSDFSACCAYFNVMFLTSASTPNERITLTAKLICCFEALGFPKTRVIVFLSLPFAFFIARIIGSDFFPSRMSFPTGFFVILLSPIIPIRS
jgi:hypothetical protein